MPYFSKDPERDANLENYPFLGKGGSNFEFLVALPGFFGESCGHSPVDGPLVGIPKP